jgi:branched-chain amino acid aminotransferase
MAQIWINALLRDEADDVISARDAGLLHGVGCFTTMRASAGVVLDLDRHLARLRDSCESFSIPLQYTDAQLAAAASTLLKANGLADARLRLTVTRGPARNDPVHGVISVPTVLISAGAFEPYPALLYERGMTVRLVDQFKLNPFDPQAGHKTIDYLARLSELREANRRGAQEALWFSVHNQLQSACVANVVVVKNGAMYTPPTNAELRDPAVRDAYAGITRSCVLPGVTRANVIARAGSIGIDVRLASIDINQLLDADELFITNCVMGVMPVCRVERKAIGAEEPGPITRKLM